MGSCGLTREESARSPRRPGRGGAGAGRGGASRRAGHSPGLRPGRVRGAAGGEGRGAEEREGSVGSSGSRGAQAGPQKVFSPPGAPVPRAAPDKGGAFLKRRRPLQAAAGMAARAGAGRGHGPEGVGSRACRPGLAGV